MPQINTLPPIPKEHFMKHLPRFTTAVCGCGVCEARMFRHRWVCVWSLYVNCEQGICGCRPLYVCLVILNNHVAPSWLVHSLRPKTVPINVSDFWLLLMQMGSGVSIYCAGGHSFDIHVVL